MLPSPAVFLTTGLPSLPYLWQQSRQKQLCVGVSVAPAALLAWHRSLNPSQSLVLSNTLGSEPNSGCVGIRSYLPASAVMQ